MSTAQSDRAATNTDARKILHGHEDRDGRRLCLKAGFPYDESGENYSAKGHIHAGLWVKPLKDDIFERSSTNSGQEFWEELTGAELELQPAGESETWDLKIKDSPSGPEMYTGKALCSNKGFRYTYDFFSSLYNHDQGVEDAGESDEEDSQGSLLEIAHKLASENKKSTEANNTFANEDGLALSQATAIYKLHVDPRTLTEASVPDPDLRAKLSNLTWTAEGSAQVSMRGSLVDN
ncbi:hypothetical protein BD324DRAFT_650207 [Kockovaella imperatae]|uniref:Uncharacterized protein n=1 Tax=Kockovaella imperatae TaxID=4999 RepID=A0A1Y1UHV3_9TREE|nr:hypothetical protein BD324DRAFT_650207 [Kockovaella imperatae]ORX37643.1 hypothetical protein BD324DRAFT_650207 [Kockovaella imperatae]